MISYPQLCFRGVSGSFGRPLLLLATAALLLLQPQPHAVPGTLLDAVSAAAVAEDTPVPLLVAVSDLQEPQDALLRSCCAARAKRSWKLFQFPQEP